MTPPTSILQISSTEPAIKPADATNLHGTYTTSRHTYTWDDLPIEGGGIATTPSPQYLESLSKYTTPTPRPSEISASASNDGSESKTVHITTANTGTQSTKPPSPATSSPFAGVAGRVKVSDGLGLVGAVVIAFLI
jgi:hypothetical protein